MLALWFVIASLVVAVSGLDNGVGVVPPMGWNTWNTFRCNYTERTIMEMADFMISSGLMNAGYKYLNLDDCWEGQRNDAGAAIHNASTREHFILLSSMAFCFSLGILAEDRGKFPSGMAALSDYVHSKGLKFGIYSSSGARTCQHYEGSWGHWQQDAQLFAQWGVDALKLDCCYQDNVADAMHSYHEMGAALNSTGRPVLYICDDDELMLRVNNQERPWLWAQPVCNTARIWYDIDDTWVSTMDILDHAVNLEPFAGPGFFNDLDMLTVGMGGQSISEYRAQMSLWSLLASPLILGADLRLLSQDALQLLLNPEVIAVNQDPSAYAAQQVRRSSDGSYEIWARHVGLPDGHQGGAVHRYRHHAAGRQLQTANRADVQLQNPAAVGAEPTATDATRKHAAGTASSAGGSLNRGHGHAATPSYQTATDFVVVLLNRGNQLQNITLNFKDDLYGDVLCCPPPNPDVVVHVRDLWLKQDLGTVTNEFAVAVASHDAAMLVLRLIHRGPHDKAIV